MMAARCWRRLRSPAAEDVPTGELAATCGAAPLDEPAEPEISVQIFGSATAEVHLIAGDDFSEGSRRNAIRQGADAAWPACHSGQYL
jgi:hypothetical protein